MGFRIQRSIKLGKFLRMNISKSGIGFSAGVKGLRFGTGPRGSYINVGIPGTGLSYRKNFNISKKLSGSQPDTPTQNSNVNSPDYPSPSFFASREEKELANGLEKYNDGLIDEALNHFLKSASAGEAGAAILAAAILSKQEEQEQKAIELLEEIVQTDAEFPTPLMEKYLAESDVEIDITPNVAVTVPVGGLAATLLLVELYQAGRRVREAIILLEEIEQLSGEPSLTLSLCELYFIRHMWDEVIQRASQTESEDNVTLETLILYGRALQEKEMHEAASTIFTKALRRKKKRSPILLGEARYWRAISYMKQGKRQKANTELQKVYADDPNFRNIAQLLAELR